jgi:hypothetical protein
MKEILHTYPVSEHTQDISWSPNGKYILYCTDKLFILNPETNEKREVYSSCGAYFQWVDNNEIFIQNDIDRKYYIIEINQS